jgi:nucleoside-diphosphate-sugar epimerase
MGERALVTGAAGFIASHVCERLLARGHEVVGVDCFTDYYARALKEGNAGGLREHPRFHLVEADLADSDLRPLLDGVADVYHLAGQPGVRASFGAGFERCLRNNVIATERLLEAAAGASVRAFVYASSSSVYGDAAAHPTPEHAPLLPVSPYGVSKVAAEDLARAYHRSAGVPAVGLRFFSAYGPRQRPDMALARFLRRAVAGEPVTVYGDGGQRRDFTYVGDIADGVVAAAERGRPGAIYNLGGGAPTSINGLVGLLEELLERPVAVRRERAARGEARVTSADASLAERELAFRARVPLRDGVAAQLDWMLGRADRLTPSLAIG